MMVAIAKQMVERKLTVDDLEAMPDVEKWELIGGELHEIMPSGYRHGKLGLRISVPFGAYVMEHDLGEVVILDVGFVVTADGDTVLAPDIAFVAKDRVPTGDDAVKIARFAPDLAVEILSPSNRPIEFANKVRLYLEGGVRLLWIVDPDDQTVTVLRMGRPAARLGIEDTLDGEDVVPGFQLPLKHLFA